MGIFTKATWAVLVAVLLSGFYACGGDGGGYDEEDYKLIRGRVENTQGKPFLFARVILRQDDDVTVYSDASGTFKMEGYAEDGSLQLDVEVGDSRSSIVFDGLPRQRALVEVVIVVEQDTGKSRGTISRVELMADKF